MVLTESFEDAMIHRDKFRAQDPAVYNQHRQFARPVPSLNPNEEDVHDVSLEHDHENIELSQNHVDDENGQNGDESSENENGLENDGVEQEPSHANLTAENIDVPETNHIEHEQNEEENVNDENDTGSENDGDEQEQRRANLTAENVCMPEIDKSEHEQNEEINVNAENENGFENDGSGQEQVIVQSEQGKHVLPAVAIDADEENAISCLFSGDGNISNSQSESNTLASICLEEGETAQVENGKVLITKSIDEDLQMVYTHGEKPKPLQPLYHVKINDQISGNIPFKENVRKIYVFE